MQTRLVIVATVLIATPISAVMAAPLRPAPRENGYVGLSGPSRNQASSEVCLSEKATGRTVCHDRSVWVAINKRLVRTSAISTGR